MRSSSIAAESGISPRDERSPRGGRRSERKGGAAAPTASAAPFWRRALGGGRVFFRLLILGFGVIVVVGVPINALLLQEGPHPAPLFRFGGAPAETKPAAVAVKEAPLPRARPSSLGPVATEQAPAPAKGEPAKAVSKPVDAIAQLIGGGAAKSDAANAKNKNKTVVFAQHALAKLGYRLHEDGMLGGTTREAIEKFERANGMPVTGELSAKILKMLSAKSGVAMR